jgi:DNA-binding transcriptional MerR regulator
LTPETGGKGGCNPYQLFKAEHMETARAIRMAQSLGFSLKEIAAFNEESRAGALILRVIAADLRKPSRAFRLR